MRLTHGFSKKLENHAHTTVLHFFFYYNFIRKHQTLKTAPAVVTGLANAPFAVLDLVEIIAAEEEKLGGRLTEDLLSPRISD